MHTHNVTRYEPSRWGISQKPQRITVEVGRRCSKRFQVSGPDGMPASIKSVKPTLLLGGVWITAFSDTLTIEGTANRCGTQTVDATVQAGNEKATLTFEVEAKQPPWRPFLTARP